MNLVLLKDTFGVSIKWSRFIAGKFGETCEKKKQPRFVEWVGGEGDHFSNSKFLWARLIIGRKVKDTLLTNALSFGVLSSLLNLERRRTREENQRRRTGQKHFKSPGQILVQGPQIVGRESGFTYLGHSCLVLRMPLFIVS